MHTLSRLRSFSSMLDEAVINATQSDMSEGKLPLVSQTHHRQGATSYRGNHKRGKASRVARDPSNSI